MKKIQKITSFLTAAVMLCGAAMPAEPLMQLGTVITAKAATSGTCGDKLTWKYDRTSKTLTISGTGEMTDYGHPDMAPWETFVNDITYVNMKDGITSIGNFAFYDCSSLGFVTIPDSVTSIGNAAFEYCDSLISVTIPDSVESIGNFAFGWCDSLRYVRIPDSVTSISGGAFINCPALTSVIIENPDCKIFDAKYTICNAYIASANTYVFSGTIYGEKNSTAQTYAETCDYAFDTLENACKLGDVNLDNTINAGDAAMTLSAAAAYGATGRYGNLTDIQIAAADIDGNDAVNASDATYILQYAAIKGANGKEFDIRELVK